MTINIFINHIQKFLQNRKEWIIYIFSIVLMGVDYTYLRHQLFSSAETPIVGFIGGLGDFALIFLPYIFLPQKWRWSILLPIWIFTIGFVLQLYYYRFFNDIMPPQMLLAYGNIDKHLIGATLLQFKMSDILLLVSPIILTLLVCLIGGNYRFTKSDKIYVCCITLIILIIGQFCYYKNSIQFWDKAEGPYNPLYYFRDTSGFKRDIQFRKCGIIASSPAYGRDLIKSLCSSHISKEEIAKIDNFLKHYNASGSTSGDKEKPNVVYIIVESLNSDAVGRKINKFQITPVIDSLAQCKGTVYMNHVVSQTKFCNSSDGHLILFTGLLPPKDLPYFYNFGTSNRFPSFVKALDGYESFMVLADNGAIWSETRIFWNFGIQNIINITQYGAKYIGLSADEKMFKEAALEIKKLKKPYFLGLMTISMHLPFDDPGIKMPKEINEAPNLTELKKHYLASLHSFDKALGQFIKILPDNTIVFITSDHSISMNDDDASEVRPAMFMALNTGRTERIERTVGQVNLYPATLDILNISGPGEYSGIAPSALNPMVNGSINSQWQIFGNPSKETLDTLKQAYEVADLIIRGDYFKGKF